MRAEMLARVSQKTPLTSEDLKEERDQAVPVSDRRALQGGEAASAKALW